MVLTHDVGMALSWNPTAAVTTLSSTNISMFDEQQVARDVAVPTGDNISIDAGWETFWSLNVLNSFHVVPAAISSLAKMPQEQLHT